jgi:hypothetical protein
MEVVLIQQNDLYLLFRIFLKNLRPANPLPTKTILGNSLSGILGIYFLLCVSFFIRIMDFVVAD